MHAEKGHTSVGWITLLNSQPYNSVKLLFVLNVAMLKLIWVSESLPTFGKHFPFCGWSVSCVWSLQKAVSRQHSHSSLHITPNHYQELLSISQSFVFAPNDFLSLACAETAVSLTCFSSQNELLCTLQGFYLATLSAWGSPELISGESSMQAAPQQPRLRELPASYFTLARIFTKN